MSKSTDKKDPRKARIPVRYIHEPGEDELHAACLLVLTDTRLRPLKEFLQRVATENVDPAQPGADRRIWHIAGRRDLAADIFTKALSEPKKPEGTNNG